MLEDKEASVNLRQWVWGLLFVFMGIEALAAVYYIKALLGLGI
jgi:hypothetical protein